VKRNTNLAAIYLKLKIRGKNKNFQNSKAINISIFYKNKTCITLNKILNHNIQYRTSYYLDDRQSHKNSKLENYRAIR